MNDGAYTLRLRLTPARLILLIIAIIILLWLMTLFIIRHLPPSTDSGWSTPVVMAGSVDMRSHLSVHLWNQRLVGIRSGGRFYHLRNDGSWLERTFPVFDAGKHGHIYPVFIDQQSPNAVFSRDNYTRHHEQAIDTLFRATLRQDGQVTVGDVTVLQTLAGEVFGKKFPRSTSASDISMWCGSATVADSQIYAPLYAYRLDHNGPNKYPNATGATYCALVASTNAGISWKMASEVALPGDGPVTVHATSDQLHLLSSQDAHSIWFSTRLKDATGWSDPERISDTVKGRELVATEQDALHLCWMDTRLKKGLGFFIYGDWDIGRANNLVFYRRYLESDANWNKERKLSGKLNHCEHPTMSVEDGRIVIAWHHYTKRFSRASIYFAVSKDNGQTWTKARKVASQSKPIAQAPQVILHNGVIHLFYNSADGPLQPGDMVHQHRPFPD